MSTNCIDNCGNERTGKDGLCDDCRLQDCPDCGSRPETALVKDMPGVFIGCQGACGHAIVFGKDYQQAVVYWNQMKQ